LRQTVAQLRRKLEESNGSAQEKSGSKAPTAASTSH
jgi:hypothetical protein